MIGEISESVWNAIPYPALVVRSDDTIRSANNAAEVFSGMSSRQLEGRPLGRFVGEDSTVLDILRQTRRGSVSVVQYDVLVHWAERPPQTFTLHAGQIAEMQGEVLLMMHPMGIAGQMDRSLGHRSAARSVTGMAAMLAHEIRNPLAGISGAAQLLSMSLSDGEHELVDLIQEETLRIGKLVERVEQFGDLRPAQRKPVNIHDVIDRAKRAAQAGFAANARFVEEYDPSLPAVLGDSDQLIQVFQNLFKNAAEAVPRVGGTIHIKTSFKQGMKLTLPGRRSESVPLLVTIRDNGTGIPENLIGDVFDPFVSSKARGTGLGLSLVSKVIADHGGVVECESVPGRTEFRIRLPVANAKSQGAEPNARTRKNPAGTGREPAQGIETEEQD